MAQHGSHEMASAARPFMKLQGFRYGMLKSAGPVAGRQAHAAMYESNWIDVPIQVSNDDISSAVSDIVTFVNKNSAQIGSLFCENISLTDGEK